MNAGVTIRQAVKSRPWPSKSAVLEYSSIWTSKAYLKENADQIADGVKVPGITSSLDPLSRTTGPARRLAGSRNISFIGSYVLGLGFTMEPEEAEELIDKDPRNKEVLFPYLNGQDLNTRPDFSASRWVIQFHNWSENRAKSYPECYKQVEQLVKPERSRNSNKTRREVWWRFTRPTPDLYEAIKELKQVIAIALVSKTAMPVMVPTGQVFAHKLGIFATDDTGILALLSSAPHYWWTVSRSSTMKADINYSPSDVFETLPLPELTNQMRALGERLNTFRQSVMLARQSGLTKTYNLVHDPDCNDVDIVELRDIHKAIDEAVCYAYGWDDLIPQLQHGHHYNGRETRYTVAPEIQREFVDRLLELNHERYAAEVAAGLHNKKSKKTTRTRQRKAKTTKQSGLF